LDASVTFREEGRAVSALARRLAVVAAPGEVVALLLPNSIEFRVAYFAALKALAAPALLNPLYPGPQLEPLLRDAAPRAVVCAPETREPVLALAEALGIPEVVCLGRGATTVAELAAEPEAPLGRREAEPSDVAALLFSGGTTGVPKAVEHTHGRLVVATRCMEYCWPTRTRGEVWLPIAPFTHVYGFLQGVLGPVSARAETVIPSASSPSASWS
jgi:long-chain acyl-CoA synthetase